MKRNRKGFTLMELLIVIAILAVLVAVAVPMLSAQLEKSREAADLANVRSAYAQVSAEAMLGNTVTAVTVDLKQKQTDWQSVDPVNIGGIVHAKGDGDTVNWKGVAAPDGTCVVSYDEACGVVLTWSGSAVPVVRPSYPFDTKKTQFFDEVLYQTAFWKNDTMKDKYNFEFDSRCPNSTYIPQIKAEIDKQTNSLLQQESCTWAFLGDGHAGQEANRYLFWTSLDTSKTSAGAKIPVLIQTGDGSYYVSETTTEGRTDGKGETYVTVSVHLYNRSQYKKVLDAGVGYTTLEEAYDAYLEALKRPEYDGVRATQTAAP